MASHVDVGEPSSEEPTRANEDANASRSGNESHEALGARVDVLERQIAVLTHG